MAFSSPFSPLLSLNGVEMHLFLTWLTVLPPITRAADGILVLLPLISAVDGI